MPTFNLLITAAIFIPFSLLTLYYFHSIVRQTIQDREELTTWTDHLSFFGLLTFQIALAILFGVLTYLVLEAKLGQ